MYDLGIKSGSFDDENYAVKYLNQLEPGDEITGKIQINDLREEEFDGKKVHKFYFIVSDSENEVKWLCGINTSVYPQDDGSVNIYGSKGSRVYMLVDSLNNVLNGEKMGAKESYSPNFEIIKNTVNNEISGNVTVRAVKSEKASAKSVNLVIVEKEAVAF